jgi:hypothetical protein
VFEETASPGRGLERQGRNSPKSRSVEERHTQSERVRRAKADARHRGFAAVDDAALGVRGLEHFRVRAADGYVPADRDDTLGAEVREFVAHEPGHAFVGLLHRILIA